MIAGLLPLLINLILLIFWLGVKLKRRISVRNDLITSLVISNFILQPSVIDIMTRLLSCQEIDKGKYYISSQLNFECYTDEYYEYVKNKRFFYKKILVFFNKVEFLSLPFLLIWCLVAPGLILSYMIIRKSSLNDRSMAAKFGFFYFGYKEKLFFWLIILINILV